MKRIKNKNKFIKNMVILMLIIISMVVILINKTYSECKENYKLSYIAKGDTLWKIAETEVKNNQYFKNKDVRNVILEIKKVNNLTTSNLSEGMQIKIPTY